MKFNSQSGIQNCSTLWANSADNKPVIFFLLVKLSQKIGFYNEANWSGSALFAKAGYIQVQQGKG